MDVLDGVRRCTQALRSHSHAIESFYKVINRKDGDDVVSDVEKKKEAARLKQEAARQKINEKFKNLRNNFESSFLDDDDDDDEDEDEDEDVDGGQVGEEEDAAVGVSMDLKSDSPSQKSDVESLGSSSLNLSLSEKEIGNLIWRKYSK